MELKEINLCVINLRKSANQNDFYGRVHNCVCVCVYVFWEESIQLSISYTVYVQFSVKDNMANSLPQLILTLLWMAFFNAHLYIFLIPSLPQLPLSSDSHVKQESTGHLDLVYRLAYCLMCVSVIVPVIFQILKGHLYYIFSPKALFWTENRSYLLTVFL